MAVAASNRYRKAYTIAELLHEAGVSVVQAEAATDETRAICGEAARMILKTQKTRPPSDETWEAVIHCLRMMYDADRRDVFAGIY